METLIVLIAVERCLSSVVVVCCCKLGLNRSFFFLFFAWFEMVLN